MFLGKPNYIARIDPATGKLLGWVDLANISPEDQPKTNDPYDPKAENTLNGIAYDRVKRPHFCDRQKLEKSLRDQIKIVFWPMNDQDRKFMTRAIELAKSGVETNDGGPFGCVVVKDGEIVGEGNNRVTSTNDPTAHAEIIAIRDACNRLDSFQLDGCTIYTSCEPCPMCLGRDLLGTSGYAYSMPAHAAMLQILDLMTTLSTRNLKKAMRPVKWFLLI